MSQSSDTKVRPPEPPPPTTPPPLRPVEFLRWIWRQLTSMRTALILLFLLAVAAIPGSLIPQQRVDPSAVVAFKDRHPDLAPLFDRIGMFTVYSSVWFSAIYLLLMVSLVGCFVPRLLVYAKASRAKPPEAPRNLTRLSAYDTWTTDDPPTVVAEQARAVLAGQRRRTIVYPGTDQAVVAAEKGYLREAGNLLFHGALLVVLVGVAITGLYGFKGSAAVITGDGFSNTLIQYDDFTPGARFDPADLAPFSFTVDDFHVTWKKDGAGAGTPLTFDADLSVVDKPGDPAHSYDLRVNHPLKVDGTSVYLVGHGYAPRVTVRDGDGRVAFSGPVIFLPQDSSFISYGVVKVPDAAPEQLGFEGYFFPTASLCDGQPCSTFPDADNPVLSLVAYRGNLGIDDGAAQSVYVLDKDKLKPFTTPGGKPRALLLREGQTVSLGNGAGSVTFDGYDRWVKLQINRAPAKVVPLVGVLLAIVGLLGSLFVRPRRTWVKVRPVDGRTVVEVAALDRVSGGDPAAHVRDVAARLRAGTRRGDGEDQE
ncbi:MAG TPA: cytochrome c biogenesis protein ResB [Nocardioidaceae bacterium]|jgi:cytochrome c biogenesis protein